MYHFSTCGTLFSIVLLDQCRLESTSHCHQRFEHTHTLTHHLRADSHCPIREFMLILGLKWPPGEYCCPAFCLLCWSVCSIWTFTLNLMHYMSTETHLKGNTETTSKPSVNTFLAHTSSETIFVSSWSDCRWWCGIRNEHKQLITSPPLKQEATCLPSTDTAGSKSDRPPEPTPSWPKKHMYHDHTRPQRTIHREMEKQ